MDLFWLGQRGGKGQLDLCRQCAGACVGTIALSLIATRIDLRKLLLAMMVLVSGFFPIFGGVTMSLPALLMVSFFIGVTLQRGGQIATILW